MAYAKAVPYTQLVIRYDPFSIFLLPIAFLVHFFLLRKKHNIFLDLPIFSGSHTNYMLKNDANIWPRLATFGPVRHFLSLFGPVWPRLTLFGTIWHHLAPFGPAWPRLAPLGPAWPRLAPLGPAWPPLAPLGH